MEKLDGDLLEFLVKKPIPLSVEEFSKRFWHLIYIMEQNNLNHWDLKLDNIGFKSLPNGDYQFKCIDFGSAEKRHLEEFDIHRIFRAFLAYLYSKNIWTNDYVEQILDYPNCYDDYKQSLQLPKTKTLTPSPT
jgi:hypothetical protein